MSSALHLASSTAPGVENAAYWNRVPVNPHGTAIHRHTTPNLAAARFSTIHGPAGEHTDAQLSNYTGEVASLASRVLADTSESSVDTVTSVVSWVMVHERRIRLSDIDAQYAQTVNPKRALRPKIYDSWRHGPIQRLAAQHDIRARSHEVAALVREQVEQSIARQLSQLGLSEVGQLQPDTAQSLIQNTVSELLATLLPQERTMLQEAITAKLARPRLLGVFAVNKAIW